MESSSRPTPGDGPQLRRFRQVAEAIGVDANQQLEEFAGEWLKGVRAALDGVEVEP